MSFDYSMISIEKVSSSLFESYMSIRPMFDLKPNLPNLGGAATARSSSNSESMSSSTSAGGQQLPQQSLASQRLYSHVFGFESLFQSTENVESARLWMTRNWTLSIPIALAYCLLVFLGRLWMAKKTRFECRLPLILWNCMLASFSILGTVRCLPEFVYTVSSKDGLYKSVCDNSYAYGITGFWAFMFVLSKLPELVDTLFIVLRKQQLIFLHWYHHATVLIYCWHSYQELASTGRWFMTMNYFVHSLMYSYYACRAMRINLPSFVSRLITTLQILQMVAGVFVNYTAYQAKSSSLTCHLSYENMFYSSIMYVSYFVLFFHFFLQAYVFKTGKRSSSSNVSSKKEAGSAAADVVVVDSNNNNSAKYDKNATTRKKQN